MRLKTNSVQKPNKSLPEQYSELETTHILNCSCLLIYPYWNSDTHKIVLSTRSFPPMTDSKNIPTEIDVFAQQLDELLNQFTEQQYQILKLVDHIEKSQHEIDDKAKSTAARIETSLGVTPDADIITDLLSLVAKMRSIDMSNMTEADQEFFDQKLERMQVLPHGHFEHYVRAALQYSNPESTQNFLYPSLLVTLVGEFEASVSNLIRFLFRLQPGLSPNDWKPGDETLTFNELSGLKSIEEAQTLIIDRKVTKILYGSLGDWISFFDKATQDKRNANSTSIRPECTEIMQRRHCVVHNGSRVSRQYLENVDNKFRKLPEDSHLTVDGEYLRDAADELFIMFYSIIWSLGAKFCKEESEYEFQKTISNITFDLLQARRFNLLRKLREEVKPPAYKLAPGRELVYNTNIWLSYKLSDDFASVRQEVENIDIRDRSEFFELSKYALLDQNHDALRVAKSLIRNEKVKFENIVTWPLLRGIDLDPLISIIFNKPRELTDGVE